MSQTCSACNRPLAPDAPQGLCPECLLKAGLGTGMDIGPDSRSGSAPARFVAPAPDELGKSFPQLELLGFVGQGGMGAVYKARQTALDRVVALKILPPGIGNDSAFADRFAREAKALARLNHSGIVTLYEFGQADGLYYFLMEFVDGVNLRHLLEAGRLSSREALAIVPQICDALQYAHDQGIVHRDIKPENILLDRLGRVKVADFGLAKLIGTAETPAASGGAAVGSIVLTDAGKVMGTPQYMAPEQSETPAAVDHRADIYSLGVVLYQMLTGELPGKPLEAPSRRVLMDVRIDEIVLRALDREPERRYQQASAFKTHIETVASDMTTPTEHVEPSTDTESEQARPWSVRMFTWVGQRGGRQVIHWPGLLRLAGLTAVLWLISGNATTLVVWGCIEETSFVYAFSCAGLYAVLLVLFAKFKPMERLEDLDALKRAHKSTGWPTWSLVHSPQLLEIHAHMTEAEQRESALQGVLFGVWNAATWFGPFFALQFMTPPLRWPIALVVLLAGLAGFPIWFRIQRQFLCSTAWARKQEIQPKQLPISVGIVLVGRRDGKAVIHWPSVLLFFVLGVTFAEAGAAYTSLALVGEIDRRFMIIPFMGVAVTVWSTVLHSLRKPVEQLRHLDGSDETGLKKTDEQPPQTGAFNPHVGTVASNSTEKTEPTVDPYSAPSPPRRRFVVVGRRNGKAVIHWPGLLINVTIAATVYLAIYNGAMLAVRGHVENLSVAQALVMVGGYATLLVYFLKKTPLDRLTDLDALNRAHKPTDWRTWSPFQSPRVIEVCNHMTDAEKREVMLRGAFFGIWNAATFFLPALIATTFPQPLNWAYGSAVLVIGLLFFPLWRRIMREFLASTEWARQQGITAESLRTQTGIRIMGSVWKILAHWQAMLLCVGLTLLFLYLTKYQPSLREIQPGILHNAVSFELIFLVFLVVLFLLPRLVRVVAKRRNESALGQDQELCEPPYSVVPRMSRAAIAGAIWAMALAVTFFFLFAYKTARVPTASALSAPVLLLKMSLLVFGLTAPLGTTLLGWVAVSQIRRSCGRLHGMWLAVFDGLLFPLLALDCAIGWACWIGMGRQLIHNGNVARRVHDSWYAAIADFLNHHQVEVVYVLLAFIFAALHYAIFQRVWYAVNKPLKTDLLAPDMTAPCRTSHTCRSDVFVLGAMFLSVLLPFLMFSLYLSHVGPSSEIKGSISPSDHRPAAHTSPVAKELPQGTIELVAVTASLGDQDQPWWDQNGAPYTGPSIWLCASTAPLLDQVGRKMVFRLAGVPMDTSAPLWKIEQANGSVGGGVMLDRRIVQDMCGFAVSLPKSIRTTNVEIGVAMGSWQTVATQAADGPGSSYAGIKGKDWTVSFVKPENTAKGAYVNITHTVRGCDTRVVAVNLSGEECTPNETHKGSLLGPFATLSAGYSGLPLNELKEFRFQVRPYHWVEFGDVALYPSGNAQAPAAPGVGVPELASRQPQKPVPNVSTLPQGTIDLVAVTSHPEVPGQPWWKQDGSPYKGEPLEVRDIQMSLQEDEIAREFVVRMSGFPEDASAYPTWRIEPLASMGVGRVLLSGEPAQDLRSIAIRLTNSVRTANVKAGVAMGAWETVGVLDSGHTSTSVFSFQGISYTLAFPTVEDTERGIHIVAVHMIRDCETRLLAVAYDQKEQTATEGGVQGSNEFICQSYTFADLSLAQVKEFRFQVRPYYWVAFNNVALYPSGNARKTD